MHEKLARLWEKKIYIGTSSWKYPGWKGLIYRKPYRTEKEFNDTCLVEYAENYTAVGVDHTFYAWPTEKGFTKYFEQTPPSFRFGLKVTEEVTIFQYPKLKRYGQKGGERNPFFLSVDHFRQSFLDPLRPFRERLGPLMLEFSQFYPGTIGSGSEFVERLDQFLGGLSDERDFQFAVELRNANWLKPPYFECLLRHHAGHVFNSWTRMPSLLEQLAAAEPHPLPFFIARALLQPGTKYEEAVEAFSPYDHLQEIHPELRRGTAALIRRAIAAGVPAYVFVNNRSEGCAPLTIEAILELIDP